MSRQAPRRGPAAGRLALVLACMLLAPPSAALTGADRKAQFQAGVQAYDTGDYAAAAEAWLPLAREDDPAAQRNLAHLYRRGLGVPQDFAEAAKWYERAADIGLASAQVNLALMYIRGQGVNRDYERAAEWLDLAARQGHVLGQYNLAMLYWRGLGVEKSPPKAMGWLYLAARAGHAGALEKLGQIVKEMPGPADTARQRRMATADPPRLDDAGPPPDEKAVVAEDLPPPAIRRTGKPSLLTKLFASGADENEADDVEQPAVSGLSGEERLEVGRAAFLSGDYAHARAMWIDLGRHGNSEAQYLLGSLYGEPRFTENNRVESYRWYYLASLNGHPGATESLQQLDRQISDDDRQAAMALVRGGTATHSDN